MATSSRVATRGVEITGLDDFREDMQRMASGLPQQMEATNLKVAGQVLSMARQKASSMGSIFARFLAPALQLFPSGKSVAIGISAGPSPERAAFFGETKRSGWYNWYRYMENSQSGGSRAGWIGGSHGSLQHPPWIGSDWDVGVAGQGPYAVNDVLAENADRIDAMYLDALEEFAKQTGAFPDS